MSYFFCGPSPGMFLFISNDLWNIQLFFAHYEIPNSLGLGGFILTKQCIVKCNSNNNFIYMPVHTNVIFMWNAKSCVKPVSLSWRVGSHSQNKSHVKKEKKKKIPILSMIQTLQIYVLCLSTHLWACLFVHISEQCLKFDPPPPPPPGTMYFVLQYAMYKGLNSA